MFERKIQFSEEMINSKDIMEKKSALDFIIDALQYLISTKGDTRNEQYKALALSVSDNMDGKVYAVVKKELDELMKLSNEYFDVRHNDYLNPRRRRGGGRKHLRRRFRNAGKLRPKGRLLA